MTFPKLDALTKADKLQDEMEKGEVDTMSIRLLQIISSLIKMRL